MVTQKTVDEVFNSSDTAKIIGKHLKQRQRFRHVTNISKMQNDLLNEGEKIVPDEFLETFKKADHAGLGALIIGRHGKPNRFKWNYNLKFLAAGIGNSKVTYFEQLDKKGKPVREKIQGKRGRPRKSEVVATSVKAKAPISITINLRPDFKSEDLSALLSLVNDLNR